MERKNVKILFDRKKQLATAQKGTVEIRVTLSRNQKYFAIKRCTKEEWLLYQKSDELQAVLIQYQAIINDMERHGEELLMENFVRYLSDFKTCKLNKSVSSRKEGFLEFLHDGIKGEKISHGTFKRKMCVYHSLVEYKKISKFNDLTPSNVKLYDKWLHDGVRADVTIYNYHKVLRQYCNIALEKKYISENPYDTCHFSPGRCKERHPLTEEELILIRDAELYGKEKKARDLFIFCAYTGLSYSDSQAFDYRTMSEEHHGTTYIDGSRIKTGTNFFTPILPPAMKILKEYGYVVPKISNQKANDYLKLVQSRLGINKKMTMHVARHSFATLCLSHDVPIEKVSRMLGHTNISVTQIYAKILKESVTKHCDNLISQLL